MPSIIKIEKDLLKIKTQSDAPVDLWNPKFCGNLNIRITRDGNWFYEGSKINRIKLVKLFSSILKKEGENYFLVTPVEKVGITVDDVPFLANSIDVQNLGDKQKVTFTTNTGETILLSENHPLRVEFNPETDEPSPYVNVRKNLDALIDRKTFYRLIDIGQPEIHLGELWFGIRSNETFFPITLQKNLTD